VGTMSHLSGLRTYRAFRRPTARDFAIPRHSGTEARMSLLPREIQEHYLKGQESRRL
jgi:hypothetical protein